MGFFSFPSALDPRGKSKFPDPFTQSILGIGGGGGDKPKPKAKSGFKFGVPTWLHGPEGRYPGVDTLLDILNNPGQTDSRLFNESIAANARSTQAAQDASRGQLTRSGFGGSGLGMALQDAIGQAGSNQAGTLYAQEAQRREDLKRSDLDFLKQYFVDPRLHIYAANKGVSLGQQQLNQQKKGAQIGAGAGLAAALIAAFACATAEELYGKDDERTRYARLYMGTMADPETREAYGTGDELAARVRRDPELREEVEGIFDTFVAHAKRIEAVA